MSNILYVIDGYLSSEDKVTVTVELINQLRKMDPSRTTTKYFRVGTL